MQRQIIQVDDRLLRERLQAFLRTPQAAPIWEPFELGLGVHLFGTLLVLVVSFIGLFTIKWTIESAKALWQVVTLRTMKGALDDPRNHPEKMVPLIAAVILVGPDKKHSLALASFEGPSKCPADWLVERAKYFGNLYTREAFSESEAPLRDILRNDIFRSDRRQRVPEPFCEGAEIYLLDIELDLQQVCIAPQEVLLTLLVTDSPGEKGSIVQAPWNIADGAVLIDRSQT